MLGPALNYPLPKDEDRRQRAVDRTGILDRSRDPGLQTVVDRAALLFRAPLAVISIIDRKRQWFAARVGIDAEESSRSVSFCAHAILRPAEPLVVPDARLDSRFANNPVVLLAPHVRFYAGYPLVDRSGYPLGALCVADFEPRYAPPEMFEFSLLAREAESLIGR